MNFLYGTGSADGSTSLLTMALNGGSGDRRMVFVGVTSAIAPTSVTYGGVAMTLINTQTYSGNVNRLYRLSSPLSGSNNVVVTFSGATSVNAAAASYNDCPINNIVDNEDTNTGTGTSLTSNLTINRPGSTVIVFAKNFTDTIVAGTNLTLRTGPSNTWGLFDSNGPLTSGSKAFQTTGTASQNIAHNLVSIKPFTTPSGFLSF